MRKLSLILFLLGLGPAIFLGLFASGYFERQYPQAFPPELTVQVAQAVEPVMEEPPPISPGEELRLSDPDKDEWGMEEENPEVDFPSVADEFTFYSPQNEPEKGLIEAGPMGESNGEFRKTTPVEESLEEIPVSPPASEAIPSLVESLRIEGPLTFCGEAVPLDNPEVRERLEKELMLSLWDRPQVLLWIKRSTRYMPIIDAKLEEAGLPRDLRYVAVAESALRPHAGSPKGAMGFWQFIKGTGKRYGLSIDKDVDERREIRRSTDAAILYFKDLYQQFGSWTLAAAAYNMGEDGLESQIIVQEQINYYHLYLPLETQRYIFRILSAKILMEHPEKFGFFLKPEDFYPLAEVENVEFSTIAKAPLTLVAKAAGISFKHIKDLNPHLRGYDLLAGDHKIMVPKGAAEGFNPRFETLFSRWFEQKAGHIYVVKPGDTLTGIAEAHGIPLPTLAMWNRINLHKPIHPGQRLLVYKRTK